MGDFFYQVLKDVPESDCEQRPPEANLFRATYQETKVIEDYRTDLPSVTQRDPPVPNSKDAGADRPPEPTAVQDG
ncbi:hypothetical protein RvY_02300 [Ramazzottius varieornatus]|uniref:Uncharacterized protein n=1 Tax=Ramazzottius varieornatus TaxID=947166 RepID=A0A1D1UJ94_RAMVA|nr:hypothetical protein RvY_02300 [Ramazzottius varieornatus]